MLIVKSSFAKRANFNGVIRGLTLPFSHLRGRSELCFYLKCSTPKKGPLVRC